VHKEIEAYMRVLTCPSCEGKRLRPEALGVTVADKSIADIVSVPLDDAISFFQGLGRGPIKVRPSKIARIKATKEVDSQGFTERERLVVDQISTEISRRLQNLIDVGLNYLTLDRSAMSLSGGEAQRIKLASELSKRSTGHTMYILDEPTTGLHFADISRLLSILRRLVNNGNTVLVIEHNLDVIKNADWLIDLGPEGGDGGGTLVAEGTPEELAEVKESYTGKYLKKMYEKQLKQKTT
jgi:excinuclease ABC subunit A